MDHIKVENITCYTKIGVADNERAIGQRLKIDLEVFFDLSKAGASDELKDTVSYVSLVEIISSLTINREFKLIEHLAAEACQAIFKEISKIQAIGIRVFKPHIPSPQFIGLPSVYIFRERNIE